MANTRRPASSAPGKEESKPSTAEQLTALQLLQARARASANTRKIDRKKFLRIFEPTIPYPGVLPKELENKRPKIAMDWIDQASSGVFGPQVQNYYMSAYLEGQEFL